MPLTKDKAAIVGELYKKYANQITRYFFRKTYDQQTAEELTQETFLKILERGHVEDIQDEKQKSYLYKCARNNLYEHYRYKEKVNTGINTIVVLHKEEFIKDEELENCFIEGEVMSTIVDTINNEADILQKELIERRYYRNENIRSICIEKKISRYKVNQSLERLWRTVRDHIGNYYE